MSRSRKNLFFAFLPIFLAGMSGSQARASDGEDAFCAKLLGTKISKHELRNLQEEENQKYLSRWDETYFISMRHQFPLEDSIIEDLNAYYAKFKTVPLRDNWGNMGASESDMIYVLPALIQAPQTRKLLDPGILAITDKIDFHSEHSIDAGMLNQFYRLHGYLPVMTFHNNHGAEKHLFQKLPAMAKSPEVLKDLDPPVKAALQSVDFSDPDWFRIQRLEIFIQVRQMVPPAHYHFQTLYTSYRKFLNEGRLHVFSPETIAVIERSIEEKRPYSLLEAAEAMNAFVAENHRLPKSGSYKDRGSREYKLYNLMQARRKDPKFIAALSPGTQKLVFEKWPDLPRP